MLTTTGIIIGVSAVIVLVALGNGIQAGFTEQFSALTTQIQVSSSSEGDRNAQPLTGHPRRADGDLRGQRGGFLVNPAWMLPSAERARMHPTKTPMMMPVVVSTERSQAQLEVPRRVRGTAQQEHR